MTKLSDEYVLFGCYSCYSVFLVRKGIVAEQRARYTGIDPYKTLNCKTCGEDMDDLTTTKNWFSPTHPKQVGKDMGLKVQRWSGRRTAKPNEAHSERKKPKLILHSTKDLA